jgi:Family of unknown function (DUF6010)
MSVVVPLFIGVVYVLLSSLIPDPHRRPFSAIMVAGAGAAYLSGGGLGVGEALFAGLMAFVAYRGLTSWRFIGRCSADGPPDPAVTATGPPPPRR